MLKLVRPHEKYKDSYLRAAAEYKQVGMFVNVDIQEAKEDFSKFVKKIRNRKYGKDLPPTYPQPEIEYWLVDEETFIGRVGIRPQLSNKQKKKIGHIGISIRPSKRKKGYGLKGLKIALKKARSEGLNKVLLICKKSNKASQKIIKKIGGELIEILELKNEPDRLRFQLELNE